MNLERDLVGKRGKSCCSWLGQAQAKHVVQHLFMPRLGQTLSLSWMSRIDSYFPRPVGSPASPPAWERGGRLAVRDLGRHRQTCSSTFVHASSWPNIVLVMVKQNLSLFLTPRYGGVASVASQKSVTVPSRKNLCPCNATGRLALAYKTLSFHWIWVDSHPRNLCCVWVELQCRSINIAVLVPSRKKLCPCNAAGRPAFAYKTLSWHWIWVDSRPRNLCCVWVELQCRSINIAVLVPSLKNLCVSLIFMLSEAESALLDASICLRALALWGVGYSAMLVLADARACEW